MFEINVEIYENYDMKRKKTEYEGLIMSVQPKYRFTPEEYLALEREAEYKSEYFDGEIFAMSGASRKHILIFGNIHAAFHHQLRKRRCEVYSSDMRVRISGTGLYTYPDVIKD